MNLIMMISGGVDGGRVALDRSNVDCESLHSCVIPRSEVGVLNRHE
jgi:hypothetical protein